MATTLSRVVISAVGVPPRPATFAAAFPEGLKGTKPFDDIAVLRDAGARANAAELSLQASRPRLPVHLPAEFCLAATHNSRFRTEEKNKVGDIENAVGIENGG